MVDLFFLKTFISVAETKSFRVAAEHNHITQPAVSQHVRILEQKLDCTLLERKGKNVNLTEAGQTFYTYAKNILNLYEEAKTNIDEMQNKFTGTIRIATIYSIGLHKLQRIMRKFLKQYPEVNIHLEYAQSQKIYEMIEANHIDFGFVAYPKKIPGIAIREFDKDDLVIAQSPEHRILTKKKTTLKDLDDKKFVSFSSGIPTGKSIKQFLRKHNIAPNLIHTYENVETLKTATSIGMGFSIIPHSTIARELKDKSLEIVPLKALNLQRPIGLVHLNGKSFTKAMQSFYNLFD